MEWEGMSSQSLLGTTIGFISKTLNHKFMKITFDTVGLGSKTVRYIKCSFNQFNPATI